MDIVVAVVVVLVVVVAVKYHELLAAKLAKNSDGTTEQTCKVLKSYFKNCFTQLNFAQCKIRSHAVAVSLSACIIIDQFAIRI